MPSTIGYTGYNGLGGPTANYLKAKPSTRFATRDLAFLVIDTDVSSYFNNYLDSDSNFALVVRTVQLQAEIYAVGTPSNGVVTIVVAIDTVNDGDNISETPGNPDQENSMAKTISNVLSNAGVPIDSVVFKKLVGGGLSSQNITLWSTDGSTAG
jgi:hypothetical protein